MGSDDVKRFLRARGCPDEVVEGGIEALVESWEHTAEQVRRGYPLGLDDYLNDIDARQLIEDLVAAIPTAATEPLLGRIEAADMTMQESGGRVPVGRRHRRARRLDPGGQLVVLRLPSQPGTANARGAGGAVSARPDRNRLP